MTVETAIRTVLANDPGVTALVDGRVYQLILPQDADLPAVLVQLISEPTSQHLRGVDRLTGARVQTDVYAPTTSGTDPYAVAEDVAAAIDAALSGRKLDVGTGDGRHVANVQRLSRRPLYEGGELREVRMQQDFAVWSAPID